MKHQLTKEQAATVDRLFGNGTAARMQSQRNNEPVPDLAAQLKELRRKVETMKSYRNYFEPEKLQPLLSPSAALLGQTKEQQPSITSNSVQRVDAVLAIADRLLLQREAVQKLIERIGFDEVEAVLNTLAGEKSMKQLKSSEGWPVTHVTISDVEIMAYRRKESKVMKETTDPLKRFLSPKLVK